MIITDYKKIDDMIRSQIDFDYDEDDYKMFINILKEHIIPIGYEMRICSNDDKFILFSNIYFNNILSISCDIEVFILIFTNIADNIFWFAETNYSMGYKVHSIIILNSLIDACECVIKNITFNFYSHIINQHECLKYLFQIKIKAADRIIMYMSNHLVHMGIISVECVKKIFHVYGDYIQKKYINIEKMIIYIKHNYDNLKNLGYRIKPFSQILADIGTGLVTNVNLYKYGINHIILSHICFKYANENLIREFTSAENLDHLKKNITTTLHLTEVMEILYNFDKEIKNTEKKYTIRERFGNDMDPVYFVSAIKFILQLLYANDINKAIMFLDGFGKIFPEINEKMQKCIYNASNKL
jgi:hypothetical protein